MKNKIVHVVIIEYQGIIENVMVFDKEADANKEYMTTINQQYDENFTDINKCIDFIRMLREEEESDWQIFLYDRKVR